MSDATNIEKLADIIEEKRRRAEKIRSELSMVPVRREDQLLEAEELEQEADRIEAAWKREMSKIASKKGADFGQLGNAAAMREALEKITDWMEKHTAIFSVQVSPREEDPDEVEREKDEAISLARAALSAPPRQCDVGTVEEQTKRKIEFCYKQRGCSNCSFSKSATLTQCAFAWAQMPYEEGATK